MALTSGHPVARKHEIRRAESKAKWDKIMKRKSAAATVLSALVQECENCGAKSSQKKLVLNNDNICTQCIDEQQKLAEEGYGDFA